ncbi:DNRLRE domain-containing protein [Microbacterium pygmaeum]|uniref:DNRLRE domain-containing protein n=1 Tax=Microbacterium pygmaeum TaxID=370764 RepID=UPI0038B40C08
MGLLSKPSWNSGPDRITYLGFNLSSLAGKTVTSAVLSTENMITDGALDTARVDAHSVAGSWSESAVTYTNKPALGATRRKLPHRSHPEIHVRRHHRLCRITRRQPHESTLSRPHARQRGRQ